MNTRPHVIAFDTETSKGHPFALGVSDRYRIVRCWPVAKRQGLLRLLAQIRDSARDAKNHNAGLIAAAHFLRFDLTVLVVAYLGTTWRHHFDREHFTLKVGDAVIEGHVGGPAFGTIRFPHYSVTLLDTAAYFPMSLNRAAAMVGLKEQKLGKPEGLGHRIIPMAEIRPYLNRDVVLCQRVAEKIVDWWQDWKIRPAVSAPHFASRVFRHSFVKRAWVGVPREVEHKALLAYHGGKNGFYGKAGWYKKVYSYDIRSAYCWAMTQIPNMTEGEWLWRKRPPTSSEFGFVTISGQTPKTQRFPVLFTHDFQPLAAAANFNALTITTMEYTTMRSLYPTWRPTVTATCLWKPDRKGPSDLARYAQEMWKRRNAAREAGNKTEEELYKLLANSLYGKFIARVEEEDGYRKGEIFYAPVAAWITALVRCRIARLEHATDALHTSTDGFLCLKPVRSGLSSRLGGLKFVNVGPLVILRNKCYLHFKVNGTCDHAALHGFQGHAIHLWRMIQSGKTTYVRERLSGLLESYRGAGLPYAPMTRRMRLNVPDGMAAVRAKGGNPFNVRPRF